jgi:NADPH:quinone reductase-like Zn-dependent oxidoreductase
MRAVRQHALGGPEVLVVEEVPRPKPGPTEVLVRVAAAGVNPVDWKVRTRGGLLGELPFTVGWDVAGVVEELGVGVTWLSVGDRVFGMPRFPREAACYAEYVSSPSRHLTRIPDGLSDVEAAAIPLAGLTAWQSLVETAGVGEGSSMLVLGAAGGVGHFAVQIAKARGAWVAGTSSIEKHDFLSVLGVDEPLDKNGPLDIEVDVVFDAVGGDAALAAPPARLVVTVSSSSVATLREAGLNAVGILVEPDRGGLEGLVAAGVRPHVEATFPLEEAARAHELGEQGRTRGKIVVTV